MKTREEIEAMIERALGVRERTGNAIGTYADGVQSALEWVIGDNDDDPIDS